MSNDDLDSGSSPQSRDSQSQADHNIDVIAPAAEVGFVDFPDGVLSSSTASYDELDTPLDEDPPERPNRVRFRSRVRITSGLNRHRHRSRSDQDYLTFSTASSISGSPSSSISAPLRTRADEEVGKPGWGTLGQRVSLLAQGNPQQRRVRQQRERMLLKKSVERGIIPCANTREINEQTPLINSLSFRNSNERGHTNNSRIGESGSEREDETLLLSREIDVVFGTWPGRLVNRHWWWWQLEPVVCCRCLSDSDDEG
ncbi:hypothetical protein B0H34DRAFT_683499 [Crassisporium funariophilum]|nr:hypothetical protein B0H34DRAFT_683499 [Crassisporium funariophilum]